MESHVTCLETLGALGFLKELNANIYYGFARA